MKDVSSWYSKEVTSKTIGKDEKVLGSTVGTWRQAATKALSNRKDDRAVGKFKFEKQWHEKILSHGSSRDKILLKYKLISSNPLLHYKHLDNLIAMVSPAKKRDCSTAIEMLQKLFIQLLPKSRLLISFDQRPFHILDATKDVANSDERVRKKKGKDGKDGKKKVEICAKRDECLALWLFEDSLKKRYEEFLTNMETVVLRDVLEQNKKKAIGAMFALLQKRPEQRSRLIRILVNKIGDPSGKLASHVKHKLLLAVHEKQVFVPAFVDEFEQMLYRPNIPEKAQYFVLCCLNSMHLKKKSASGGDGIPLKLIKIYCSFFKAALDKKKIVKKKMLGALLSGIYRTFPYLLREEVTDHLKSHINDLFRLVHTTTTFSQSVQTLMVLFHLSHYQEDLKDRFYQVLYRKIGDWRLIRRSSQRQSLLLHLIYRSLSEDDDLPRLRAFTKRLLQLCLYSSDTPLICGLLLVISELQKVHPEIISTHQLCAKTGKTGALDNDDSDEEFFPDIDSDLEEEEKVENERKRQAFKATQPSTNQSTSKPSGYDPTARNPRFCGAEKECTWELLQLKNNFYHPSVRVFSTSILSGTPIDYSGDPFEDFTRIHFLDRFIQKKPKKVVADQSHVTAKARSLAINSEEYRNLEDHEIPEDEKCFHEFSKAQGERKLRKQGIKANEKDEGEEEEKEEEEDDDDVESVPDEDFDVYLDQYEKGMDTDLKDLDNLVGSDDSDDELMDLSDEEISLDLSDDDDDDEGLSVDENANDFDEEEFSSQSELDEEKDDDDDDEFMEVDEDDEDDDDEPFSNGRFNSVSYGGHKETAAERKQRQWEERRTQGGFRKLGSQRGKQKRPFNRGNFHGRGKRGGKQTFKHKRRR